MIIDGIEYLTVAEAAKLIGRSARRVYELVEQKQITGLWLGQRGMMLVVAESARAWQAKPRGNPNFKKRK